MVILTVGNPLLVYLLMLRYLGGYTYNRKPFNCMSISKVVCPNFGHPDLTLHFTRYKFSHVQNSFATIENGLSVLKLFELSNSDLLFL